MCGICGVYGKNLINSEVEAFKTLFHVSALRGMDSSGILAIHKGEKTNKYYTAIKKSNLTSTELLYHTEKELETYQKEKNPIAMIGHCRLATQGKITKKNAHPFDFPNVSGVHNGTITSPLKDRDLFDTDSETLYHLINKNGVEKTIKDLKTFGAAYALVFFDKKNQTLNFLRNDERPLYFAETNFNTIYFASEKDFLSFTLKRHKILYKEIISLKKDTLLTFDISKKDKIIEPKTKELKPNPIIYQQHKWDETWEEKWKNTWTDKTKDRPDFKDNIIPLLKNKKDKYGKPVTMYKWKNSWMNAEGLDKVMKNGCAWCTDNSLNHLDFNNIMWSSDIEFICKSCLDLNPDLKDITNGMNLEKGTIPYIAPEDKDFDDKLPIIMH
jgi:asparagine synthetase B (glutamine-hydrolysing)